MASSTSYVASSSSIENIPTTTNNNEHDDMVANKNDVINLRHKVCNGVVRNTSYPTLSLEATTTSAKTPTLSQSLSAQNVKKSVSTVFSSGNRKSWQLSLSNYSQENVARKDSSSSPRKGDLQLKTFSEQSVPLIRTSSGSKDNYACSPVRRSQSNVIVYSDESASKRLLQDESNLAQGQNVGQGENRAVGQGQNRDLGQGVNRDSGQNQNCEIGQGYAANFDCGDRTEGDCANDTDNQNYGNRGAEGTPSPEGYQQQQSCYVLNEQQRSGSSCRVQSPSCHPGAALTWSNYQEPHQLRHQGPNTSNHSSHNQQHSTSPGADNSMELSMYSSTFPNTQICAAGEDSSGHRANSTTQQNAGPSGSANSPNCDQSVSVLQTSGQSESLSFSSQGKRKDSDKTVRYSAEIEWKDGHSRKRNQSRDYGCEKRVRESGTLASDCVLDTQPLLPVLRVRMDGGSNSGSPDMSMDNQLVRFHSLDSKESYRSEQCERSPQLMQRAISVNTTTNLALDPSHLLVQGGFGSASSPTGSDSLAAPPLNELYRYHVFLSHCAEDVGWVEEVVARLQAPPYCYKCAYSPVVDEQDPAAPEQNLLCSAMLSERVVLVLSEQYVETTWFVFEKVLRQLTQMSLHNQRIMGVLLEDCHIPDTLGELYFLDTSDPDFFDVFTKRLKTGRIPRSSESVSSDLAGRNSIALPSVVNGQTLAQCTLAVKVGWDSYLEIADSSEDLPPSLKSHGINLEKTEFYALVQNVSTVLNGSNKLPWVLCIQPLMALLLAAALWLPAFITVLAVQVDDNSGMALPVRLVVFVFPLGIVSCGYLLKWRRRYWLSKVVRVLVQNCVKANQVLYCEGRPVLTTASHVRANNFARNYYPALLVNFTAFASSGGLTMLRVYALAVKNAVYFIYFDLTDCVRSVDLLLFTCLEDDWDKLMRLVEFYARDKSYLLQVSMSERLTVMTASAYLFKLVRGVLPHPPQQRHINGQLCLCQFTEECVTRFVHSLDREDITALAELFTRHLFGYVSGSAVHRVNTELFHRLQ